MMDKRGLRSATNRRFARFGMVLASVYVKAGGAMFPVFILLLWYVFGRGIRARFFVPQGDKAACR
jgi:hypothetical protein